MQIATASAELQQAARERNQAKKGSSVPQPVRELNDMCCLTCVLRQGLADIGAVPLNRPQQPCRSKRRV